MGRVRAYSSPSNRTSPRARAATGGTNRITVPASPVSTRAPCMAPGTTVQPCAPSSTLTPRARSAPAISWVSRASRGSRSSEGPSLTAPSSRARAVWDFEPGRAMSERTEATARGAVQGVGTRPVCRTRLIRRGPRLEGMCGRYVSVQADADLLAEFDAVYAAQERDADIGYNVAPTEQIRAVVNRRQRDPDGRAVGGPVRQLRVMSWGLVPSWSKNRGGAARMINARAESVARTPAFRKAFGARRCLIPADGWYEWRRGTDAAGAPDKQAFYMTPQDSHGLAFAGLYEFWSPPGDTLAGTSTSATILTTASVGALAEIHDRMPLVLPRSAWARWLDPTVADPADLLRAWDEADGERLELRPVSSRVNSVKNDDAGLIEPVALPAQSQRLF